MNGAREQVVQGSRHLESAYGHVTEVAMNMLTLEDKLTAAIKGIETALNGLSSAKEDINRITNSSHRAQQQMRTSAGLFTEAALPMNEALIPADTEGSPITGMIEGLRKQAAGLQDIEMKGEDRKAVLNNLIGRLAFVGDALRDHMLPMTRENRTVLSNNLEKSSGAYPVIIESWLRQIDS
jgi:hypothetical protein